MPFHRIAHTSKNYYPVGTIVKKGQPIAEIGNAGGFYKGAAHVHWDIFRDRPGSWLEYTQGKLRSTVEKIYIDPVEYGGAKTILPNVTHFGWRHLDKIRFLYYHAGLDVNSGGGDNDFGDVILSPVDGVVEHVKSSRDVDAWGGMTVIGQLSVMNSPISTPPPIVTPSGPVEVIGAAGINPRMDTVPIQLTCEEELAEYKKRFGPLL